MLCFDVDTNSLREAFMSDGTLADKIAAAVVVSRYYNITFAKALSTVCKMSN